MLDPQCSEGKTFRSYNALYGSQKITFFLETDSGLSVTIIAFAFYHHCKLSSAWLAHQFIVRYEVMYASGHILS